MRTRIASLTLLALAATLSPMTAFGQAAGANANRGGPDLGGGGSEPVALMAVPTYPQARRTHDGCERRLKTVVVGNEVYFAYVDCFEKK